MVNEFIIKRSEWLRGEGLTNSSLRRKSDNKKCCLGFFSLACGYTEKHIDGCVDPAEIHNNEFIPEFLLMNQNNTYICGMLQEINDDPNTPDEHKEEEIAKIFAENNVKVTFVD